MTDLSDKIDKLIASVPEEEWDKVPDSHGWMSIKSAPKDFTGIIACALGADGRPLIAIVHWACAAHSHLSHPRDCGLSADCDMRWLGSLGSRYGVEFTHWQPLPEAPYGN